MTWTDATDLWLPWVSARAAAFRHDHERRAHLHGEPLAARLMRFHDAAHSTFAGGGVGGVRITGRR